MKKWWWYHIGGTSLSGGSFNSIPAWVDITVMLMMWFFILAWVDITVKLMMWHFIQSVMQLCIAQLMWDMAPSWPHNFTILPWCATSWLVSFPDLAAGWYSTCLGIRYALCTQILRTVCVNSMYIKHSISLKRSLDRPRTSTVLEHTYYFIDVLHVNF